MRASSGTRLFSHFCSRRRYDYRATFFTAIRNIQISRTTVRYKPMGERNRELFQVLAGIKGKFLLSVDDSVEIRALSKEFAFRVTRVKVAYSLAKKGVTRQLNQWVESWEHAERFRRFIAA